MKAGPFDPSLPLFAATPSDCCSGYRREAFARRYRSTVRYVAVADATGFKVGSVLDARRGVLPATSNPRAG